MINQKKVTGVLVAAGRSARMGFDKLFYRIDKKEILLWSLEKLANNVFVDEVVVVAGDNRPKVEELLQSHSVGKPVYIVQGGETRVQSVAAGVAASEGADLVAIHDAARPFVSDELITRVVEAADTVGAAAPCLPVQDTVKQQKEGFVVATVPRSNLAAVQTPQVFARAAFVEAFSPIPQEEYPLITDDCMVMERAGKPVLLVEGEKANRKITTQEDLQKDGNVASVRVGHGYDVHRLVTGRELILGGVTISHTKGLLGHSDADVLCHAITDALFGAAALGDIGVHFPNSDPVYKGACSLALLKQSAGVVREAGYLVKNLDATLLCESPKLAPHVLAMRRNVAKAIGAEVGNVSIKATTEEGLGFSGRGEGIAAHCVALLQEY